MIINGVHMNDEGRPVDRFDLEQEILKVWHTVDDLKTLIKRLECMNEDQIMNALLGLEIFADMRCQSLWDTYESYLSNGRNKSGDKRQTEITEALDEAIESFGQEKL